MSILEVSTEETDGAIRLGLKGELDISSAPQVEEQLSRVEQNRPDLILIDLRELEFMDSTGLRVIVGADARARDERRRVAIVRGPEAVQRIFDVTRLDERLDIVDDPGAVAGTG